MGRRFRDQFLVGQTPNVMWWAGASAAALLLGSTARFLLLSPSQLSRFFKLLFPINWLLSFRLWATHCSNSESVAEKKFMDKDKSEECRVVTAEVTTNDEDADVEETTLTKRQAFLSDDSDALCGVVQTRIRFVKKENDKNNDSLANTAEELKRSSCEDGSASLECVPPHFIPPEQHLVYVRTFGCSHNSSDSEFMMGLLQAQGYRFTESLDNATICLINSCTVKNPSQDAFMNVVRRAKQLKKPVIVAGCVPQADRNLEGLETVSIVGTTQIAKIVDVFEETLKGNRVCWLTKGALPPLDIPKVRRNKLIEIIPISSGCLGACTYCKTRHARGRLGSYTPEAITHRIRTAVEEGVQQIWLTSEDVGAYGIDLNTDIAKLLEVCLNTLEAIEKATKQRIMMRLGMTNPPYMAKHIHAVASALTHRNCFRFIHIPVQSGSTEVLKKMVREYTIEDFTSLADTLIARVPNITIATDIICGFPTETAADHEKTVQLIQQYKFPVVNISQFYPRPGTPAARMTRVPTEVVKSRSSEISALFRSYTRTDFLLGSYQRVWFDDVNEANHQSVGHTIHYVKVVVPFDPTLLGTSRWVRVTNTAKWQVEGELVEEQFSPEIDEIYGDAVKQHLHVA